MNRLAIALLCLLALLAPTLARGDEPPFTLTPEQKARIGKRIWANECGGRIAGLTSWNAGEEFPSLGIGHFIWYPRGFEGPFEESFPKLIAFARKRGATPPAVALQPDCPWNSKGEFEADLNGPELKALRTWLANTINLQTDFIITRSREALGKIKDAAPADQAARIERNYGKVATTPNGVYALIDYVNFKGEGVNPKERYNGKGWGLMWVLTEMKDVPSGQPAAREFAAAAKRVLDRRIANSPPERGEERWRQGWHNRCDGYAEPF